MPRLDCRRIDLVGDSSEMPSRRHLIFSQVSELVMWHLERHVAVVDLFDLFPFGSRQHRAVVAEKFETIPGRRIVARRDLNGTGGFKRYNCQPAGRRGRDADIDNIASSGPFQLTITTLERAVWHYGDRKDFNFVLKQHIMEAGYNQLWLQLERKNGKLP